MNPAEPQAQPNRFIEVFQPSGERSQEQLINMTELSPEEIQHLVQELRTSQANLESENKKLRQTRQQFEALFKKFADLYERAPVGYFTLDENGIIIEANLVGAEILGVSREKLLKQPLRHFIAQNSQDNFVAHCTQTLKAKTRQVCELRLIKADGSQTDARLESISTSDSEDENQYRTAISLISEQRQTEKILAQRNRELELLNLAGQAFISSLNIDEILNTVLEGVRHLLDVIACSVWLVDPASNELVCRQVTAPQSQVILGWRLAAGQGLAGWVVQHGEVLNVPDAQSDARHYKAIDERTGLNLRSILTVPLRIKQDIIGVVQVVDEEVNRFDLTDLQLVESLAATAAIAIENAKLYEQAVHDAETKEMLLNEVNHRVRNNLGIIIGLLTLEQQNLDEQTADNGQSPLKDLANKVQGLAIVHDLLSASEWAPLTLTTLAQQIVYACLQILAANKQITVKVRPSPIDVSPNQAHSLALVINELATNAVKYAWPDQDKGQITIRAGLDADIAVFEFRDDGQGYPEDVLKQKRQNIGFELIRNIVRRGLKGRIILDNDGGAVTMIRFNVGGQAKNPPTVDQESDKATKK